MSATERKVIGQKEFEYHADLGFVNGLKYALAFKVRKKIFDLFMREFRPTQQSRVADLGVTANRGDRVHYFFEMLYPYPKSLTGIGREDAYWYCEAFPGMTYINADLRTIPLPDRYFDYAICNAVVEHAGDRESQARLVHEVCRVSKAVMVTTPNAGFPVDPHTFVPFAHWLPERAYRVVLRGLGLSQFASIDVLNPLRGRDFVALFPSSRRNRLLHIGLPLARTNLVCVSTVDDGAQ